MMMVQERESGDENDAVIPQTKQGKQDEDQVPGGDKGCTMTSFTRMEQCINNK